MHVALMVPEVPPRGLAFMAFFILAAVSSSARCASRSSGIWGLDGGHLGEVQKGVKLPPKLGGARGLLGLSELWEAGYYIVDVAIGLVLEVLPRPLPAF